MKIIPAVLEKDFQSMERKLDFLLFLKKKYNLAFDTVQIDLCDGKFVENHTWLPNLEKKEEIEKIILYRDIFNIEYHVMCENQYKYFLELKDLKTKRLVIHIDEIWNTEELENILTHAKENFIKVLISSKLDFMSKYREDIVSFLHRHTSVDLQIMGIDRIGVQGNEFDEKCLSLIRFFRKNFKEKDLHIQVDGSMNENTISLASRAGANASVVGSYLMRDLNEMKFVSRYREISNF